MVAGLMVLVADLVLLVASLVLMVASLVVLVAGLVVLVAGLVILVACLVVLVGGSVLVDDLSYSLCSNCLSDLKRPSCKTLLPMFGFESPCGEYCRQFAIQKAG